MSDDVIGLMDEDEEETARISSTTSDAILLDLEDDDIVSEESFTDKIVLFDDNEEEEQTVILLPFDDDESFLEGMSDEEIEQLPRMGIDTPASESVQQYLTQYSRVMEMLRKVSESSHADRDLSKELMRNLVNSADMTFLNARQQSSLLLLVSATDDKKQILEAFLKEEKIKTRHKLQLDKVVTQLMSSFKEILNRNKILRGVTDLVSRQMLGKHINVIIDDLKFMNSFIKKADGESQVTYVERVKVYGQGINYVCGNCKESNESSRDFVRFMIHENLGSRGEYVQVFPSGKKCEHCGWLNVLTYEEHYKVHSIFNDRYNELLTSWSMKSREKLSSATNVISYIPSKSEMPHCLPHLYEEASDGVLKEEVKADTSSTVLNRWYEETLNLVRQLNVSTGPGVGGLDISTGVARIKFDELYTSLDVLAQMYCNLFNEDYTTLRQNAVMSVLRYLRENPSLVSSLSNEAIYSNEILLLYRNYLTADLEDNYDEVYSQVCSQLGIEFDTLYSDGVLDLGKREEINSEIEDALNKVEANLVIIKNNQKKALNSLNRTVPLYRYLDIKYALVDDLSELYGVLVLPEVREWISRSSTLMILNRVAPKALDFWKVLKVDGWKNASIFNTKSKKTFAELVDNMLKVYGDHFQRHGSVSSPIIQRKEFLSRTFVNIQLVDVFYKLKIAVENLDYYQLSLAVVEIVSRFEHPASAFDGLKEFLRETYPSAEKFVEEHVGKGDLFSYYKYHYSDLFSNTEIEEGLSSVKDRIKKPYRLNRLEGENFQEYILRVKDSKYDPETCKIDRDADLFKQVYAYIPDIYGTLEFFNAIASYKDNYESRMFMNDIIMYSHLFGSKFMYRFLGLGLPSVEFFEREFDFGFPSLSEDKLKIEFFLRNLIYPSAEVNLIVGGGDEEVGDIIAFASAEPESMLEQLKHFGDFRSYVYEHYTG